MQNIKVKFTGPRVPSGKDIGAEYWVGEARLKLIDKENNMNYEVLEKPEAPKPKKKKDKK